MREGESLNWRSFLLIFVRFLTLLRTFAELHWISLIFFRLDKSFPSFSRYIIWIFAQSQVDGQRVKNSPWELKKSRELLSINSIFLEWVLKTSSLLNSSRATCSLPKRLCVEHFVSNFISLLKYFLKWNIAKCNIKWLKYDRWWMWFKFWAGCLFVENDKDAGCVTSCNLQSNWSVHCPLIQSPTVNFIMSWELLITWTYLSGRTCISSSLTY